MIALVAAILLPVAQDVPDPPRDWSGRNPLVSYLPDSRMETPTPTGSWTGQASVTVRCIITESGGFDDCRVLEEAPTGRINTRTVVGAFRNTRLDLGNPAGPRAGDTITTEVVLSRARIRR